ncbi:uncharacterized protein AAG666_009846 isoform 1-T1 [Megaptera novaeangliae]
MTEGEYVHSLYAISLYALWRHLPPGIQRLPPGIQRSNPILSLSRFQVGEHQVTSLNPNQNQLNEWTQDLQAVSQKKVPCSRPGLEKKNTAGGYSSQVTMRTFLAPTSSRQDRKMEFIIFHILGKVTEEKNSMKT